MSYGSGECDQLGLGENSPPLRKRGTPIKYFDENNIELVQIVAGGSHTLALTNDGKVYSWGCNDELTLGRDGSEFTPGLVEIDARITGICAGDSHSIAYSTETNEVYWWGLYRNS